MPLTTVEQAVARGGTRRSGLLGFVERNAVAWGENGPLVDEDAVVAPHRMKLGHRRFDVALHLNSQRSELTILGWKRPDSIADSKIRRAYTARVGHRAGRRVQLAASRLGETTAEILAAGDNTGMEAGAFGFLAAVFSPVVVAWKLTRSTAETVGIAVHRPSEIRNFRESVNAMEARVLSQ